MVKVEPIDKAPEEGRSRRKWHCFGPCMISFGIPLLIPGVTLTCVALSSNTGAEMFTGLHITGYIFLAVGIFLVCTGCVVYNVLRIKVGPLPVVLVSHVDLRMTRSQRLYLKDNPTFFIRTNSAKPSTCFRMENETSPTKQNFRGSGKVSIIPGQFNKHGEQVSAHDVKTVNGSKLPSGRPTHATNHKGSSPPSESDSTEDSSSSSDSEDCTTSSCSSSSTGTDTSTNSSESSLQTNVKTVGQNSIDRNVPSVLPPVNAQAHNNLVSKTSFLNTAFNTHPKTSVTSIQSTPNLDSGRLDKWENGALSDRTRLKRTSEDIKSEELRPSQPASLAWHNGARGSRNRDMEASKHGLHSRMTSSGTDGDNEDDSGDETSDNGDNDDSTDENSIESEKSTESRDFHSSENKPSTQSSAPRVLHRQRVHLSIKPVL